MGFTSLFSTISIRGFFEKKSDWGGSKCSQYKKLTV